MSDPEGPGDAAPKGEHEDRPGLDIDTLFAAIVADFSSPSAPGGPWPASENLDDDPPPDVEPHAVRRIVLPIEPPPVRPGAHRAPADPAGLGDEEDELDDEGFVPPEPPPFPKGDLLSRVAWAAVVGGPLFLLIAALTWQELPSVLLLLALVAFVGGFVTLVARMPADPPDDPDDGAVV